MVVSILVLGACLAIAALRQENREKIRLQRALDTERARHAATVEESNRLRAELQQSQNEVAELRALREGGPFRSSS